MVVGAVVVDDNGNGNDSGNGGDISSGNCSGSTYYCIPNSKSQN